MKKRKSTGLAADLESLYLQFLHAFYEVGDHKEAHRVAGLLEAELAGRIGFSESIRGDEIRSLLAELNSNLSLAIEFRESEIRKIFELHLMVQGTPGWDYVRQQYDYSDIGDRLDLLANLYAKTGNYQRAIDVLRESKNFCSSHRIPFDGAGMLADFTKQDHESRAVSS